MTKMTQEEFEEVIKDKIKCTDFKYNHIQPERSKPLEAREDFVKHDYMLETPKAL